MALLTAYGRLATFFLPKGIMRMAWYRTLSAVGVPAVWVSSRNRAKTYGKVATVRRCVEKPTLPRIAIFGKDINET
jgi:hypothetical protein